MMKKKSTVDEIRQRFDNDVERFSSLESGHAAAVDSLLTLDLLTQAAAACTPNAKSMLDIGCGAGNYTLKLLKRLPNLEVTLVDLSLPMLERAVRRISQITTEKIQSCQVDIREIDLGENRYDIILAAAVFHHLRTDAEWENVFAKCFTALRPGGGLWITDLIMHDHRAIQALMWRGYGEYLVELESQSYRDRVLATIEREDTPRPLLFQVHLLKSVGFRSVEILHKNSVFAVFGGIK